MYMYLILRLKVKTEQFERNLLYIFLILSMNLKMLCSETIMICNPYPLSGCRDLLLFDHIIATAYKYPVSGRGKYYFWEENPQADANIRFQKLTSSKCITLLNQWSMIVGKQLLYTFRISCLNMIIKILHLEIWKCNKMKNKTYHSVELFLKIPLCRTISKNTTLSNHF